MTLEIREIKTDDAPGAIGPYSQAIRAGGFLFLSGAIPLDPETGAPVPGGIEAQTERVLKNIEAVLRAGGSSIAQVVKTTVYLSDLALFSDFNRVYEGFFSPPYPARSTVEVRGLPLGVDIEIDAVALAGG